jgi:hypothetical protein
MVACIFRSAAMPLDKPTWVQRFASELLMLKPETPVGLLPEIAETFWYYQRHREPELLARERAAGQLRVPGRRRAWIEACSAAIRQLDPQLANEDTFALALSLWEEDWARSVDPYLMAQALWDQAILLSMHGDGQPDRGIDLFSVFRLPPAA